MKVILFGSTGMVGKSVLRQCLLDPDVESVLSIGRRSSGVSHPKLRDLVREDMFDFNVNAGELNGYDACFFCLGVSSVRVNEACGARRVPWKRSDHAKHRMADDERYRTFIAPCGIIVTGPPDHYF